MTGQIKKQQMKSAFLYLRLGVVEELDKQTNQIALDDILTEPCLELSVLLRNNTTNTPAAVLEIITCI